MNEKKELENKSSEKAAKLADDIKQSVSIAKDAAKLAGAALPPMINNAGKVAEIAAEAIRNPAPGWGEKIVCGAAKVLSQGAAMAPLAGQAFVQGSAAVKSQNKYAKAAGGLSAVYVASPAIQEVTKPIGEAARAACHKAFDRFNTPEPVSKAESAKQNQHDAAQKNRTDATIRQQTNNGFQPNIPATIPLAQYNANNTPYRPYFHPPRMHFMPYNVRHELNATLLRSGNSLSFTDRMYIESRINAACGYFDFQMRSGFGHSLGMGDFRSTLSMTGLNSSYNSYNLQGLINDALRSNGEIGGVAGDVSVITDLIDSEAHAEASSYFLCFPTEQFPFPIALINQIATELKNAYFTHKTLPFFSLHFNNSGFLYPVSHSAYNETLTGEILALLDYWMKGFLNGGIFDADFLKKWHEQSNCDEHHLRAHLIDLKKYSKSQALTGRYISLRELESRYGVKEQNTGPSSAYTQPFMTSFRIIASQEAVKRHGNILVPQSTFRVEYSIDLMPDYKEFLEKYRKEHGDYPADYEHIRHCYELFAKEIEEKMPQMPFCRDYFQLLGVINSLCYTYASFEQMGKVPVLEQTTPIEPHSVPKAFPPIPVRYFRTYAMPITFGDVFTPLISTPKEAQEIDAAFLELFNHKKISTVPAQISNRLRQRVIDLTLNELRKVVPPSEPIELNEEEIERITKDSSQFLLAQARQASTAISRIINLWLEPAALQEKKSILGLALPAKLKETQKLLNARVTSLKQRWESAAELTIDEMLRALPKGLHEPIKANFKAVDEQLLGELSANTTQLNTIKQSLQDQLTQARQAIAQQEQHKAAQINNVPVHLRSLQANVTAINNFVASVNQQIAQIQMAVTQIEQRIAEVDKELRDLQSAITAGLSNKSGTKTPLQQRVQEGKNAAYKQVALHILTKNHEQNTKDLERFTLLCNHFSQTLSGAAGINQQVLSKEYTHTIMGFTGNDLATKTGDRFQIVGGCGMSLPNIESRALDNAEEFSVSLARALTKESNQPVEFTFNGQQYISLEIPVTNAHTYEVAALQSPLVQLLNPEVNSSALNKELGDNELDSSGSRLVHYAASALNAASFSLFTPEQLKRCDKLGNLPIHFAAQTGNVAVVTEILTKYPEMVDAKNARGLTPLFVAIQNNQLAAVQLLIANNANANYKLVNGLFPLFVALQNNFQELALWLIEQIPTLNLNEEIDSKMTALHLAIEAQADQVALRLIEKGALCTIKRKSDGFSTLHCAAKEGQVALLRAMQAKGYHLHTPVESGKTALHIAAEASQLAVIDFLLAQGADCNLKTLDGDTALMLAIKTGNLQAALRLATQANVNAVNNQQQTASQLAIQYGMPAVADKLIERGENPELRDNKGHNTVYYLVRSGEESRFNALLAANKIDLKQEFQGSNLVEIAAKYGQFLIVYDLVAAKVPFRKKGLLHYAVIADEVGYLKDQANLGLDEKINLATLTAQHGSVNCLAWLIKQLPTAQLQNQQLLYAALESQSPKVIDMVFQRLTDFNQSIDALGNTPLHMAVTYGVKVAIEPFLKRGASVQTRNKAGQTVFHIALAQEDNSLLKHLFKQSQPSDWPLDLWSNPAIKPGSLLHKTLERFKKRLPQHKAPEFVHTPAISHSLPSIMITPELSEGLTTLKQLFSGEQFDEAVELLIEQPELIKLFHAEQGAGLLQCLFDNISDYSELLAAVSKDAKEVDLPDLSADKLLAHLKQSGINPMRYIGKHNVLIAMLRAKTDKEACYKLRVFAQYFPDCLSSLALDSTGNSIKIVEMALKLNKPKLFETLDELCSANKTAQTSPLCGLHEAVLANNYELVKSLLKRYPVNCLNPKRQTPLMLAAAADNVRMMELLLDQGANPDCLDIYGHNALHHALFKNAEAAALTILPLLKTKNCPNRSGVTPLMLAAGKGLHSVVNYLSEQGDYTESFDNRGFNALHHAAAKGQVKAIRQLVAQGFSVHCCETPAKAQKIERSLKRCPLHLAALYGHEQAVTSLLALGANPLQEDSQHNTVFEYAVKSKKNNLLTILQQLDAYHDKTRDIPLLLAAAQADNIEMLSQLILCDVNLNGTNDDGLTALHVAAMNNSIKTAQLLLVGKDVALDVCAQNAMTPLHYAAYCGHVAQVELLLEAGAKINYHSSNQPTALFLACQNGQLGAVAALLKNKADRSIPNHEGITPEQIATMNGHTAIVRKLQNATAPIVLGDLVIKHGIYRQTAPSRSRACEPNRKSDVPENSL